MTNERSGSLRRIIFFEERLADISEGTSLREALMTAAGERKVTGWGSASVAGAVPSE